MELILNNKSAASLAKNNAETMRTIVVVEDDEGLNLLILKSLKKEGFSIKGISTGEQAIKAAIEMLIELKAAI